MCKRHFAGNCYFQKWIKKAEWKLASWASLWCDVPAHGIENTAIALSLIRAYEGTEFHVNAVPPFILKVNRYSIRLKKLFKSEEVGSATFITAQNPHSHVLSAKENASRNNQLQADIKKLGFVWIDGIGKNSENECESEDSFLVLGIGLDDAKELGVAYGQNAIIWCGEDVIPRLVLLR